MGDRAAMDDGDVNDPNRTYAEAIARLNPAPCLWL